MRFEFGLRLADASEIKQLEADPAGMIFKMEIPEITVARCQKFCGRISAHTTNKT